MSTHDGSTSRGLKSDDKGTQSSKAPEDPKPSQLPSFKPSIISSLISNIAPRPSVDPQIVAEMTSTMVNPYGSASYYALAIVIGFFTSALAGVWSLFVFPFSVNLTGIIILGTFVVVGFAAQAVRDHFVLTYLLKTRHFQVRANRPGSKGQDYLAGSDKYPGPDITKLPAAYYLYVLGSGGHSTEMALMIRYKYRGNANMHRRYVMGDSDVFSLQLETGLEATIRDAYPLATGGTYDSLSVTRARSVGQSYITSVITSLLCAFEVLVALTAVPRERSVKKYGKEFASPHVVFTNGPGTGFIVCVVAHFLKMFFLAPQTHLKLVYIESWARVENLSLTGKLFHYTGIADLFLVQSEVLAQKFNKQNIGLVAVRGAPAGLKQAGAKG